MQKYTFTLEYCGAVWKVKISTASGRKRTGTGWHEFVRANSIKVGDVLAFHMVPARKLYFVVKIIP